MPRTKGISDQVLLDGCRATFVREGLTVSTRRLAQSVGVSEGLLFQRFGTKDALFLACMQLPPPALDEALEGARRRASLQAALVVLGAAALDYLRAQMPILLLVLAHPRHRDGTWAAKDSRWLLSNARTMREPFAVLLETHPRSSVEPRDRPALIELLVSALLTRAIHEQLGVDEAGNDGPWLRRTIAALGRGFGQP